MKYKKISKGLVLLETITTIVMNLPPTKIPFLLKARAKWKSNLVEMKNNKKSMNINKTTSMIKTATTKMGMNNMMNMVVTIMMISTKTIHYKMMVGID